MDVPLTKQFSCSGNNNVDHVSEEVLKGLDRQTERSVDSLLYRSSVKTDFPMEFQITFNILCLFSSWVCYRGD
jgi:uncharacterized metal-binding protein